jgi:hypothetical protein
MTERERRRRHEARVEGSLQYIASLLEDVAGVDDREQCPTCGKWFKQVSSHRPHCDGPE